MALTNWPKLEGKTHITKDELHRAQVIASRFNSFLADRAREEGVKSEAAMRHCAWRLLPETPSRSST